MSGVYRINKPEEDSWSKIKDYQDAQYLSERIKQVKSKGKISSKNKYLLLRAIATSECFKEMRILLINELESKDDE